MNAFPISEMTLPRFTSSYELLTVYPPPLISTTPSARTPPPYVQTTCVLPSQSSLYLPFLMILFFLLLAIKVATSFRLKRSSSGASSNGLPLPSSSSSHTRSLSKSIFSSHHNEVFDVTADDDEHGHPSLYSPGLENRDRNGHVRRVSRVESWKPEGFSSQRWLKQHRLINFFKEIAVEMGRLVWPGGVLFMLSFTWFSMK